MRLLYLKEDLRREQLADKRLMRDFYLFERVLLLKCEKIANVKETLRAFFVRKGSFGD